MILFNQHDFNAYCRNNAGRNGPVEQAWAISRSDHNRLMSVPLEPSRFRANPNGIVCLGAAGKGYGLYSQLMAYLRANLHLLSKGGEWFLVTSCTPHCTVWVWLQPNTLPQPVRSQDKDFGVG